MKRKMNVSLTIIACLFFVFKGLAQDTEKPNIIIWVADDQYL